MNSKAKKEKNCTKSKSFKTTIYFEILLSLQKIRDKMKCFFLEFLARVFVKEEPSWVRYQKYNKTHPKSCHSPRSVVDNLYFPLLALDESTR